MFRKHDIVKAPDGRVGIVARRQFSTSLPKRFGLACITVQFGADGPFEDFSEATLCFSSEEELQSAGGVDFFSKGK